MYGPFIMKKTTNLETDKVRKGINQIRDGKRWIEQNNGYFLTQKA